jgi:type II secretory pathway pseudopilin PulG
MRTDRRECGFTLVELLVVTGLIVVVVAVLGTFFLGGPSPAVAAAARDIGAAFDEARETATAFDEATVVFTPNATGYSARVYRQMPGAPAFAAVNGPTYDSTVTIAETAAPLGAPAFAFRIDSRGTVTGYQNFDPAAATFTERTCPAGGNFVLALAYERQKRTIDVPCAISLAQNTPALTVTPSPAPTTAPDAPGTCSPGPPCAATLPPFTPTCPPGYTPDGTQPNVCDSPTPTPTAPPTSPSTTAPPTTPPTCPPGYPGSYPNCGPITNPSPSVIGSDSIASTGTFTCSKEPVGDWTCLGVKTIDGAGFVAPSTTVTIDGQADAGTNAGNGGFNVSADWYIVAPSGARYLIAACGPSTGRCDATTGETYALPEGPGNYHFAVTATFSGLFNADQIPNPQLPLNVSLNDTVVEQ